MFSINDFTYTVEYSLIDKCFIGRVKEFESLAAHGDTEQSALNEIKNVVQFVLEDSELDFEVIKK